MLLLQLIELMLPMSLDLANTLGVTSPTGLLVEGATQTLFFHDYLLRPYFSHSFLFISFRSTCL